MKKKGSKKKKLTLEIILVIALLIFVLSMIFNNSGASAEDIWEAFITADFRYFFAAVGALILYFIIYYSSLELICHFSEVKAKRSDVFLISNSEFFFNGITPGAVGGQPFQVFAFKQIGVPASQSTGLILMNFVCGMIAQFILAAISLSCYHYVLEKAPNMIGWFWVGCGVQALTVFFFMFLGFSKTFRKIMIKFVNWIASWRIFRRAKNIGKNFECYITNAQTAFSKCWEHKRVFILGTFLKLLSYICLYTIPFFILKAVKVPVEQVNASKIFIIICITSFACMTANYLPTPGATGGIEIAFQNFIGPILVFTVAGGTQEQIAQAAAAVLLWRLVTYYLLMFFSFLCYTVFTHKAQVKYGTGEVVNDAKSIDTSNPLCQDLNESEENDITSEEVKVKVEVEEIDRHDD